MGNKLYHHIMRKHFKEFQGAAMNPENYEISPGGIHFLKQDVFFRGIYCDWINGEPVGMSDNLIPDEGKLAALNILFGATAKAAAYYLALYAGAVDPASGWTASNFASTATENTSTSEGYSGSNRPEWVDGTAAANAISNSASKASYSIVASSTININGVAMLSVATRGATTGHLMSATRFGSTRQLANGDTYQLAYEIQAG